MAAKTTKKSPSSSTSKARKNHAADQIVGLVDMIVTTASKKKDPALEIPQRTLSNANYNKSKRIIEMGNKSATRNFFDMGKAKNFMQTVLISSGCKKLIDDGKTSSIRGMYYLSKHTIPGTNEKTFNDQDESDPIIEDIEVSLQSLREELHLFASQRGSIAGNLTLVSKGDEIDLRRMGSGGWGIPGIVEPDVMQFKKCEAKFILHVEKDTVWQRFNEDKFWKEHNCIITHGNGQPPRGVRRLLYRMHRELNLPLYCLLDNDPWGYYIYSVIKQGSINLAYESERMAIPNAKFLGIRAIDYDRCELTDDVQIDLNDRDIARAKQIAAYPWFVDNKPWQKEIERMLKNGFKMEVESLITKDISYVTEVYVPERLKERDWLD